MIWSFAYKLDGSDEEIVVATTRPETMLGDTAVAVHPDDPRYKQYHGKFLVHPFVDRKIPIITDAVLVDMSFGTGAVKVTPAHDPNDFATGRRHNLDEITIFTDEGAMAANTGQFAGMMRLDARVEVLKALKEKGLSRGEADNKMRLGKCSRTGDIIEPMLKPQWWIDCSGMAKRATDAVRSGAARRPRPAPARGRGTRRVRAAPLHSPHGALVCGTLVCGALVCGPLATSHRPSPPCSRRHTVPPLHTRGIHAFASHLGRRAQDHPGGAQEDVVPLAGQHPRLVRLAPALVGAPHPRLLRVHQGGGPSRADCRWLAR